MIFTIVCVTMLMTFATGAPNIQELPDTVPGTKETENVPENSQGTIVTQDIAGISPEGDAVISDAQGPPKSSNPECNVGVNETHVYSRCTFTCDDQAQALRNSEPCILSEQEVTSLQGSDIVPATMKNGVCREGQCVKQGPKVRTEGDDGENSGPKSEESE
uniref:10 kDa acidid metastriate family member n=1 Tax=Rhipicephalus zambeziensis TaxID=60191 RepID=A0A224Y9R4_9ACAR